MAAIEVFNRYEKKFVVDAQKCKKLIEDIEEFTVMDKHNKGFKPYSIHNIYYDTHDDNLIRTSILKPNYKEKLRVRSYGIPTLDDIVYLEIKKKYKGVTNKRRICITLSKAYDFLENRKIPTDDYINKQILKELEYCLEFYHPVAKLYLAYDRYAYFSKEDKNLRISFDTNIRSRRTNLRLESHDNGESLISNDKWILEVKTNKAFPLWLAKLLSSHQIYRTGFSKYGTEYKQYITNRKKEENIPCSNQFLISQL